MQAQAIREKTNGKFSSTLSSVTSYPGLVLALGLS